MTAHKAIVGALVAALTTFVASVQGRPQIDTLHVVDWLIIVASAAIAGLGVYYAPYRPTSD